MQLFRFALELNELYCDSRMMQNQPAERKRRQYATMGVWLHKYGVYLDALQVDRVHDCALKKLDGREMTLEQTLQLQIGWFSVCVRVCVCGSSSFGGCRGLRFVEINVCSRRESA